MSDKLSFISSSKSTPLQLSRRINMESSRSWYKLSYYCKISRFIIVYTTNISSYCRRWPRHNWWIQETLFSKKSYHCEQSESGGMTYTLCWWALVFFILYFNLQMIDSMCTLAWDERMPVDAPLTRDMEGGQRALLVFEVSCRLRLTCV